MGILNFDARTVQPWVGLEPVPDNWYKVIIAKSNIKPTKAADAYMLELVLQIVEGQFQGRQIYYNLNLFHKEPNVVEMAQKQLSAICHVTGVPQVQDTTTPDNMVPMLHNIPFFAHAVVNKTEQGSLLNNIRGVKDLAGNDPKPQSAPQSAQPQFAQSQAPAAPGPASWQSNAAPPAQPTWNGPSAAPAAPPAAPQQPAFTPPQPGGPAAPMAPAAPGAWQPPSTGAPAAPGSAPWGQTR